MKDKSKKLLVINTNKKPSPAQSSAQSSGGTPYGGGFGGVAFDMSDYLLKAVWDRVWEIKTDSQGNEYIFGKLPVVTQYGITMYADGGELDLPSIYAGLPIDGTTIYWDGEVLKAQGGGSGGGITDITSSMVVSALGYTPAKASDLTTLQSTVNDFLSGSDTDTIINKWKELEVFLSGLSESDNLATILGTKADKATTIAGYGITDAYTKSDVNTLLGDYVTLATAQTITGEKNFTGGLKVNGSTIVYDATNKYWKLEGDLLVTGGITMFANEGTYTPSTIMDALKLDDTTLGINDEGQLYVKSGTGGVADSVRWENVIGRPTLLSSFTDDVVAGKYLPLSGGTLTGSGNDILIINKTNGNPYIRFANNGAGLAYFGVNTSKEMVFIPQNSADILKVLHSGNYNSYALPLSGGTISGTEPLPITISNNINGGEFQVGIRLLNPNKTNTNGNTNGTAQFGYTKSNGVYMFNYDNYNYYNCAIGITDDGIAYVGKGGALDTKYKIWHEGNDGSGSGLSADMLDGYHWYDFYRSYIEEINATDVNTFVNTKHTGTYSINHNGQYSGLLLSFNRGAGSVSSIELIAPHYDFHIYGLQARIAIDNNRYSALRTFAFTDSNVASATKLQTARTIWGQSFDGSGNVDGNLTIGNTISPTKIKSFVDGNTAYTTIGGEEMPFIINNTTGCVSLWKGDNNRQLSFNRQGGIEFSATTTGGWAVSFRIKTNGGQSLGNVCGALGNAGVMTYTYYGGSYDVPNMVILPNGDVGIGTVSPSSASKLHIKSSTSVPILLESSAVECGIRFVTANSSINGRGWIGFSNSYGLSLYNYNSASYGFCMYDNGNVALCQDKGNVGIGTASPSSTLDVKGGVNAQSYGGYNGNTNISSSYKWAIYQWNNELQITRRDSSNTHKGTMAGFDLASGNVVFEAGITMYSDQRKKTILNHVELSLKQIADAPLIEHYYNSDESKTTHVGSIAQYWAEMNDWFCKKDNEGFYTMEIQNAALASAISIARELVKYESKTDKKIRLLKKRIGELEDEIEKLKTA